ncbi:MAG: 4'-phosphopantetheinyl transferase superfamily protein [Clostridia bacterium]|nr:4'-phosphopantetheinyl transferase superfamily protein [Clostridia bacterium]
MRIKENDKFSIALVNVGEDTGSFLSLPKYKKKESALSACGRIAAGVLLHRVTGADPAAVTVACAAGGKPYIIEYPDFHYNISHAGDFAAAVCSARYEVGVDIQNLHACDFRVARRCFPAAEVAALTACPAAARDQMFTRLWTEYEAVLKSRGLGLLSVEESMFLEYKKDTELFNLSDFSGNDYQLTVALRIK